MWSPNTINQDASRGLGLWTLAGLGPWMSDRYGAKVAETKWLPTGKEVEDCPGRGTQNWWKKRLELEQRKWTFAPFGPPRGKQKSRWKWQTGSPLQWKEWQGKTEMLELRTTQARVEGLYERRGELANSQRALQLLLNQLSKEVRRAWTASAGQSWLWRTRSAQPAQPICRLWRASQPWRKSAKDGFASKPETKDYCLAVFKWSSAQWSIYGPALWSGTELQASGYLDG